MQIIVVGCGKVGKALVAQLSNEGHNITVVDIDKDLVHDTSMQYDVMGVYGNGTSYQTLLDADIEHTDILIAVTEVDEVNLLCCVIAKQKTNCHTIARVRNPIYSAEREFIRGELQLSMIINPEFEAAREMARLIRFPNAMEVEGFSKDRIDMLRIRVPEKSPLINMALRDISKVTPQNMLVCVAERDGEVSIPNGDFVVQQGDVLAIMAQPGEVGMFFRKIGLHCSPVKNTVIVGGGGITYYLTEMLLRAGIDVKIIEKDKQRAESLNEMFPDAVVDIGDGSDRELLDEERLEDMDSFVACTGIDEINAILSLYAQQKVRKKVITKLNHLGFNEVINALNLDSIINPKQLTAQRILQYVRAMNNSVGSNVETLYRLLDDKVEALEFIIQKDSKIIDIPLSNLKLRDNILIAGIVRDGKLVIPGGNAVFKPGDSVIVVTTHLGFDDIYDILDNK